MGGEKLPSDVRVQALNETTSVVAEDITALREIRSVLTETAKSLFELASRLSLYQSIVDAVGLIGVGIVATILNVGIVTWRRSLEGAISILEVLWPAVIVLLTVGIVFVVGRQMRILRVQTFTLYKKLSRAERFASQFYEHSTTSIVPRFQFDLVLADTEASLSYARSLLERRGLFMLLFSGPSYRFDLDEMDRMSKDRSTSRRMSAATFQPEAEMRVPIEDVLRNALVSDACEVLNTFLIHIGDLTPTITIRVVRYFDREGVWFQQSHFLKTPLQATPYRTSNTSGTNVADALHSAIRTLTSFYHEATGAGHKPSDSWLVPNEHF
jgi:hypothetical protein